MAKSEQVTVGDKTYNITQVVAKEQKRVLTMIGAMCAINAASADSVTIDMPFLRGVLLAVGDEKIDKLESILFPRVFIAGEDHPVTIDSFQNNMAGYLSVLAHAIKFNLEDYFALLDEERAAARLEATKGIKAE